MNLKNMRYYYIILKKLSPDMKARPLCIYGSREKVEAALARFKAIDNGAEYYVMEAQYRGE